MRFTFEIDLVNLSTCPSSGSWVRNYWRVSFFGRNERVLSNSPHPTHLFQIIFYGLSRFYPIHIFPYFLFLNLKFKCFSFKNCKRFKRNCRCFNYSVHLLYGDCSFLHIRLHIWINFFICLNFWDQFQH
jgi:hypothetical protein